ncbi:class I SAM-dependent methyltransferase [Actinomadura macrotermitis]|uniref:Ubiquinone/menaquinone biosynthesis C-methyltransferase UbiE n=1 Tax=Actinomadura macrotermitis TaxID=2585200 RepID=A0A7K0BV54_9ACTN|nr:class I SAM-dependent methyltransferase [Actinomadura macrotermitis]MQY05027.1 Ubiquinone/menaquinone biosynthesis C-methyltransferase UbiE [Actinomadura macrotermitis]
MTRARYGVDSPFIVIAHYAVGTTALAGGAVWLAMAGGVVWRVLAVLLVLFAVVTLAECTGIVISGRYGKRRLWRGLIEDLALRGDEQILDVGTGSGQQLAAVARHLTSGGHATGVDIWRAWDHSGNSRERALANMRAEGVADRTTLTHGDMRDLPFSDGRFDIVISTLVVHNLPDPADRATALREMVRVLRPGGRLMLVDFWRTHTYLEPLRAAGCLDVEVSGLRYLPFPHVRVLTARRAPVLDGAPPAAPARHSERNAADPS